MKYNKQRSLWVTLSGKAIKKYCKGLKLFVANDNKKFCKKIKPLLGNKVEGNNAIILVQNNLITDDKRLAQKSN